MKKLLLGSVALGALVFGGHAKAADYAPAYRAPPPPPFNWSGFYIGGHAGGGWGTKHWYNFYAGIPNLIGTDVGFHHVRGGVLGGQAGVNWQWGYWVLGIEAQASWADLNGNNAHTLFFLANSVIINNSRVDALGTVAGRLGWAFDRTLPYVKFGAAYAHDKFYSTTITTPQSEFAVARQHRWGWMLGVEVEHAFYDNWSVKIEYNYMDLGRKAIALACPLNCVGGRFDNEIAQQINVVKVGINYRFGYATPVYSKF